MTVRGSVLVDGTIRLGACALLAFASSIAQAAPPSFTGAAGAAPVPAIGNSVIVNLRQQAVLTGSAPIQLRVDGFQLNGVTTQNLFIDAVDGGQTFGRVCLLVTNLNYTVNAGDVITVQLTANNQMQETASGTIVLNDAAAATIDPADPAQVATCGDPNAPPVVNAGNDLTVPDTDGQPGETVQLNAVAMDPEGELLTYTWFVAGNDQPIAFGASPSVQLPDGVSQLLLSVSDEGGMQSGDDLVVTVAPTAVPIANAGGDRTIVDTDRQPGEPVTLDASLSSDSDGQLVAFQWSLLLPNDQLQPLGTGTRITVSLPDGANTVRLQVTDDVGNVATDFATITVGVAPDADVLSDLPNLDPTQQKTAQALDRMCADLAALVARDAPLTADQQDLLERCNGLLFGNTAANQIDALDELVTDDFAVARTQTLLFANTQFISVMDRLIALRGGARGLSLAGLNVIVDGKLVPLAQLQEMAKELLGGGASADEPGGLLSDKWGLWARGNYSFGERARTASAPSFDADQWALVGGIDYRLSDNAVLGLSLAYGESSVEFEPSSEGALDTQSWAFSLYGSAYAARNFYLDGIVNVANVGYVADRNITYVDGSGLVSTDAHGDTDGNTYSAGLSAGYDFLAGGLTVSPTLGFFYIDATIDGFTESGAAGLNLVYDEQKFKSMTGNVGLRATYAWNLSWGVLLPHVRADFVREFENDVDVFGVRFAADPNATSAPPILVETDNPDQSYWRFAAGCSAQFEYGVSGYVEYQRLESFDFIRFQDVSVGLRLQRSF
jgi:outer membrane autotransporter protein